MEVSHRTGLGSKNKWIDAYGWLFNFAAVVLFLTASAAANSKNSYSTWSSDFQSLLFGITGSTILARKKAALVLVWVTVGLSGLGVLFRGLVPLDALLWLVWLGLAVWYLKMQRSTRGEDSTAEIRDVSGRWNPTNHFRH